MAGQGHSGQAAQTKAAESLLAFWAQAGVDVSLGDAPVNRLLQPERPKPAATATPIAGPVKVGAPAADIASAIAEAQSLAAGADSLDALAAAIADFDSCGLKFEGARQAVFARGNPRADVLVIGEGPGGDEDVYGQPFVGRAGKLLDRMLAAAGLSDRVFITNTVYWRPPGNRTPTAAEQAICRPFVDKTIALVKPKLLLLAGGASAKSILARDEGILSLRGRWFEWAAADGSAVLPALPTLHPAFLLRQPAAKKKAWGDLLTLSERLDRPDRAP
jgi:uracil-DNA glycosylase